MSQWDRELCGSRPLAVFTGTGTVTLSSGNGRQFGPSVLAPYADVVVDERAGYVDGFIVAKNLGCSGQNSGQLRTGCEWRGEDGEGEGRGEAGRGLFGNEMEKDFLPLWYNTNTHPLAWDQSGDASL